MRRSSMKRSVVVEQVRAEERVPEKAADRVRGKEVEAVSPV